NRPAHELGEGRGDRRVPPGLHAALRDGGGAVRPGDRRGGPDPPRREALRRRARQDRDLPPRAPPVGRVAGRRADQAGGRAAAKALPAEEVSPMLLVIDNYDSFTFNLVQALGALGASVEVVRNDAVT